MIRTDICWTSVLYVEELFFDLDYLSGTNCTSTFADSELKTFVEGYRSDELNVDLNVIAWHNHLDSLWKGDLTGNIEGTDEELRTIVVVEWSVTSTLFLLEDVDLSLEVLVRSDGAWLGDNLTSLNLFLVDTTEEKTYIVSGLTLIEELAEHLDASDNCASWSVTETNELNRIVDVDCTGLDTTCNNGTTTGDGEDVLDRHKEWLLVLTNRLWDVLVNSVHEIHNLVFPNFLSVEGTKSGTTDDRAVLIELVESEKVTDFHLNEVKHLSVVNKVNLVHEDEDLRYVHLTGEKDVLAGLRHRTVSRGYNEDSTVHLSGTSYHVLNVVSVAWAVYVSIVALLCLVLYVSGVDGDTTLLLFRSIVDLIERLYLVGVTRDSLGENLGDCGSQSRLTVVNMADSTDVNVRLRSLESFFCHNIMI